MARPRPGKCVAALFDLESGQWWTMNAAKSYEEIIDFIAAGTTPEAVVAFRPSDAVQRRVAELTERSKEGTISPEERSELDDYLQLEHIMIMAKGTRRTARQLPVRVQLALSGRPHHQPKTRWAFGC